MMRTCLYACGSCLTLWKVVGDPQELSGLVLVAGKSPRCATAGCLGTLTMVPGPCPPLAQLYTEKEIPAASFFKSSLGFGSANGCTADVEDFKSILLSQKVVKVCAHSIGNPPRVILQQLIMDSGVTLYFDTSARGACCFYIEKPMPTCLEVVDAELRRSDNVDEAFDKLTCKGRKESGRTYSLEDFNVFARFDFDGPTPELQKSECLPAVSGTCLLQESKNSHTVP